MMFRLIRQGCYRAWQFWAALTATLSEEDERVLEEQLTPRELALFKRMSLADQRHSLDVYYTLRERGHTEPDLLKAALLHDIGKADGNLRLWHRVAIVLVRAICPAALKWLAVPDGWRYPFYVHYYHPLKGAELAEKAGCSKVTVELIRRHQRELELPPYEGIEELLKALQEVDRAK
ncbi:MAG TPA: HD domain-containing protein [Chloroflexi bacterium]|nr:HD domain-containing protein [Chloroflexota bacterium]